MDNCHIYGSTLDGMRKIVRQEGAGVLWRGTDVALLMAVPMVSSSPLLGAFWDIVANNRLSLLIMAYTGVGQGSSEFVADSLCFCAKRSEAALASEASVLAHDGQADRPQAAARELAALQSAAGRQLGAEL